MTAKNGGGQVVMVARFTLKPNHKDNGAAFEEAFGGYKDVVARHDGALGAELLGSTRRPDGYLLLTWWRDAAAKQAMMSDPDFFREIGTRFFGLATLDRVYGVVVAGATGGWQGDQHPVVTLSRYDLPEDVTAEAFERSFAAEAEQAGGALAYQLAHASPDLVGPSSGIDAHLGIIWWRDTPAALEVSPAAADTDEYRRLDSGIGAALAPTA
ncbi:antibiotic biosynthesis monooxygenase family protein [Actinoallomurus sp. CA-150999]|uniref:antibiotic biosynthesis monooxygenase family protein n=1 Tax=Actinoallomurus sp. CA-150999 TaxID=3239887 RepID=UPI003D912C6F